MRSYLLGRLHMSAHNVMTMGLLCTTCRQTYSRALLGNYYTLSPDLEGRSRKTLTTRYNHFKLFTSNAECESWISFPYPHMEQAWACQVHGHVIMQQPWKGLRSVLIRSDSASNRNRSDSTQEEKSHSTTFRNVAHCTFPFLFA